MLRATCRDPSTFHCLHFTIRRYIHSAYIAIYLNLHCLPTRTAGNMGALLLLVFFGLKVAAENTQLLLTVSPCVDERPEGRQLTKSLTEVPTCAQLDALLDYHGCEVEKRQAGNPVRERHTLRRINAIQ